MFGLIEWLIRISWKILTTVFMFSIFIALIKGGTGTIREWRDIAVEGIRLGTSKLHYWIFKKNREGT